MTKIRESIDLPMSEIGSKHSWTAEAAQSLFRTSIGASDDSLGCRCHVLACDVLPGGSRACRPDRSPAAFRQSWLPPSSDHHYVGTGPTVLRSRAPTRLCLQP